MHTEENFPNYIPSSLGHHIRREMSNVKHSFDEGGYEGLVSFIKACIEAGVVWDHLIENEAARATGDHIRERVGAVLEEGIDVHWHRNCAGELRAF